MPVSVTVCLCVCVYVCVHACVGAKFLMLYNYLVLYMQAKNLTDIITVFCLSVRYGINGGQPKEEGRG